MGYSLTEVGIGARNLSGAAVLGTKGIVVLGLSLRKLQVWPLDFKVLEEPHKTARCSNRQDSVELLQQSLK